MTEPAHYSHGPSSASRWLICTDSPFAQEGYPDETTDAADEGTAAHWLLEQCLNFNWTPEDAAEKFGHVVPADEEVGTLKEWPITGEMKEAVQLHIDTVRPDLDKRGTQLFVEERVRLDGHMELPYPVGGTADTILYLPRSKTLKIIDFKYGRGHVVEVKNDNYGINPQLGIYALATLAELERLMGKKVEVKKVEATIVQPRAPHKKGKVRTYKTTPLGLMKLEGAVRAALTGPRERIPGDHCHFCRAKPDCKAYHGDREARATADFTAEPETKEVAEPTDGLNLQKVMGQPPKGLTLETLGQIRQHLPALRSWIKEVEEEVKTRLLHDLKVPGARLGMGRGSRAYGGSPEELIAAVEATANELEVDTSDLYTQPSLQTPAALEKKLGKKAFAATPLAKLVSHKAGGPMVVDEDSDTPDWAPADVFEAEEEEKPVKHSLL